MKEGQEGCKLNAEEARVGSEDEQTADRPHEGLRIHPEDRRFNLTTARNSPAFFQRTDCCQDLQTHLA